MSVCRLVGWSVGWLVGQSVCHNFPKGREVSLLCSYRSTCLTFERWHSMKRNGETLELKLIIAAFICLRRIILFQIPVYAIDNLFIDYSLSPYRASSHHAEWKEEEGGRDRNWDLANTQTSRIWWEEGKRGGGGGRCNSSIHLCRILITIISFFYRIRKNAESLQII